MPAADTAEGGARPTKVWRRISTLLFAVLSAIAALLLAGLIVMTIRLYDMRGDLRELRDRALPRLVMLSQLSQEAAASIAIAPALSAKPTRFEFETLLSRIKDKEASQRTLIKNLRTLIRDETAERLLKKNGDLLFANLAKLTNVVREQIAVVRRLDRHAEFLRPLARTADANEAGSAVAAPTAQSRIRQLTATNVHRALNLLLDNNRARFSRNRRATDAGIGKLATTLSAAMQSAERPSLQAAQRLVAYWERNKKAIFADKATELANEFRIKALVEENSLIANRLLTSVNNEFWRASRELRAQVKRVDATSEFNVILGFVFLAGFAAGSVVVWIVLKRRVFARLDRIRAALLDFAEGRTRAAADPIKDEIGDISGSLVQYMDVIDRREDELKQLSSQLAKYLSPQVYDSIFSGRQEVKVASTRKKLTIFFSDIEGFTETADRLESEELTQLLNHYLTEMSKIALAHGATIDKYVGDAILIFFGDPESRGVKQDALACVRMAIAMRSRMLELTDIWRETGIEKPLRCRMGIHTGFCTVGNIGSEDRMDYTIIGSAVNTASRLEELAEPGEILISYETYANVKDEIACQEHGQADVRGIAYPIATYTVVDAHAVLSHRRTHILEDHPNLKLDLDLEAMSASERRQALEILRRALDTVSTSDAS